MKRTTILLTFLLMLATTSQAQHPREEIKNDPCLAGNNFLAYPAPQGKLTPAPSGKKPFYISHYGRHGSRYQTKPIDYDYACDLLQKADRQHALTALGCDVLQRLEYIRAEADNRQGDLTTVGQQQINAIMRRMVERFPQVFGKGSTVDARSTLVPRTMLSMTSALQELARQKPQLDVCFDATLNDVYYMYWMDSELIQKAQSRKAKKALDNYCKSRQHYQRLTSALFADTAFVSQYVNGERLVNYLFRTACSLQNVPNPRRLTLFDLFTEDEIYEQWQMDNAYWFLGYGFTSITGGNQPFTQRFLLRRIVEQADSCIRLDHPSANLRFGHETMLLPLVCLMGVNGFDQPIEDLNQLEQCGWVGYRVFPMACNLQLVFYRKNPSDEDVLFKVLLNENEATLPIETDVAPYYHWRDARAFFLRRLDSYKPAH